MKPTVSNTNGRIHFGRDCGLFMAEIIVPLAIRIPKLWQVHLKWVAKSA